jgi:hypothetical protein
MITKEIILKTETPDIQYTEICNKLKRQGVFITTFLKKNKKIITVQFKDELDYFAWRFAEGFITKEESEAYKKYLQTRDNNNKYDFIDPKIGMPF